VAAAVCDPMSRNRPVFYFKILQDGRAGLSWFGSKQRLLGCTHDSYGVTFQMSIWQACHPAGHWGPLWVKSRHMGCK